MNETNEIKKLFLRIVIVSLILSGLLGIFIFLFGEFKETEVKLLLTTLSLGGCSLTGLCCATIYPLAKFKVFSVIGILTAGLCFIITMLNVWGDFKNIEDTWKLLLSLIVLSVTFSHISLLLNIRPANHLVESVITVTIVIVSTVAVMLLTLIFAEFDNWEWFYRLLGSFAILDVLGSIVILILNRMQTQVKE
ncbi:MAG: hypothetical protein V4615_12595 [Bacteroidota bacterium]